MAERIKNKINMAHSIISRSQSSDDGLMTGNLGLAVYQSCVAPYLTGSGSQTAGFPGIVVEEILDRVGNGQSSLQTYFYANGLSGLGAVIQFLIERGDIEFDFNENFSTIDEFILEKALESIGNGFVEYLYGGSGALYYLLGRPQASSIVRLEEELVEAILEQVSKDTLGVRVPRGLYPWHKSDDYDLSLAHGLCGVLLILLDVLLAGKVKNTGSIHSYLQKAVTFVRQLKRTPNPSGGAFATLPHLISRDSSAEDLAGTINWGKSRLAWCYGDLGWVLFFYKYGQYVKDSEILKFADELGESTLARKTEEETSSSTAHFCHGHAGLAYMYKVLSRASGRRMYFEAAEFWLQRTLDQLDLDMEQSLYVKADREAAFLEGLVGINLVLASFLEEKDPGWGRFFLIN
jgi:lantibiotic biosynthesis protein